MNSGSFFLFSKEKEDNGMKREKTAEQGLHEAALYLRRHTPVILSCMSVAGMIGTAILTGRGTVKAMNLIMDNSGVNHEGQPYSPTKSEKVFLCWKCYIPATILGLATISCIVGARVLDKRRQASMLSAYGLLDQAYQRYRKAATSIYGEEADTKIRREAAKEVYVSGDGYFLSSPELDRRSECVLFFDQYSQRYFTATMTAVINAQYHVNRNFLLRGWVSVNELYEFIGIDGIDAGDAMGWDSYDMTVGGVSWLDFENRYFNTADGTGCYMLSAIYDPAPLFLED